MKEILSRLSGKHKEEMIMKSLLQELKAYEMDNPFGENNLTEAKLLLLRNQFARHPRWIPSNGLVLYDGSLQYGDTKKGDIDLLFISPTKPSRLEEDIFYDEFARALQYMQMPIGTDMVEAHFTTPKKIQEYARMGRLRRSRIYREDYEFQADYSARLFSGKPLFPQQVSIQQSLQREILQVTTPTFLKEMNKVFMITLHTRRERRGLRN